MVEKKKKSRRVPLHKKYKIEKKIVAHHRKVRRLARKNKAFVLRQQKKDPGIPNAWPFKLEMLEEAKLQKEKRDKLKEEQKLARQQGVQKRRREMLIPATTGGPEKPSFADVQQMARDAAKREKIYASKVQENNELKALTGEGFNGIPGVTMQAFYREFRKVVEVADIIIEVLDARDPLGCRCPDVEKMIINKYPNKRIVLLLNKIDLVPREVVEGWLKYLRNEYPTIAFKSSRQKQAKLGQYTMPVAQASDEALKGSAALGADTLLQLLKHYAKTGNVKTSVSVGIVGFPNVGKSSVINSLCRTRAVKVGGTPGVTRAAQEVHLDKHVKLLDSPGIVFPKATDAENDIILRHCVQIERIPDPISPVEVIVKRVRKPLLLSVYKVPDFDDAHEFLRHVAKTLGKVQKGGIADLKAAARKVIQDWVGGKVPFYTDPPAVDASIHVGASIVSEWSKEFDFSQNDDVLALLPTKDNYDGQKLQTNTTMGESAPVYLYEGKAADDDEELEEGDEDMDENADEDDEDEEGAHQMDKDDDDDEFDEDELAELAAMDAMSDVTSSVSGSSKSSKSTKATTSKATPSKPKATSTPIEMTTTTTITTKINKKQDLRDEADQFNPQVNQAKRKQLKDAKKKKTKKNQKKSSSDAYDFATDFGAADDIDINDIES